MRERGIAQERARRYGNFAERARVTQNITAAMADSRNWKTLAPDTRQCLQEMAIKIGRALNGDAEYADNFTDIIGLARHVERRLALRAVPDAAPRGVKGKSRKGECK